jgi:hypothetical protein
LKNSVRGQVHRIGIRRVWGGIVMIFVDSDDVIGVMKVGLGLVPCRQPKHPDNSQNQHERWEAHKCLITCKRAQSGSQ